MIPKLRFAIVFVVCVALNAQEAAPPTIRVTTRLVQVSVVVHDKKGHPVGGLKKEDFTLREQGHEKAIALFNSDSEAATQALPVQLPPDVYSNRNPSRPGHLSVILFDALNTAFADQAYARQQLLSFFRQIRPGDRVAIYVLNNSSVRVAHDFTDDADYLAKAIAENRTSPSPTLNVLDSAFASTGVDSLDAMLSGNASERFYDVKDRVRWTLKAMEGIARHLAGLTGRKNLIWVSAGFPLTLRAEAGDNFNTEAVRAARALTDANIAVYPVDARGLMTDPAFAAARPSPSSQLFTPPGHDAMRMLAEDTGGRAFINRNDVDSAIRTAVDDARVTYTLGFYTAEEDWDGKFHDIKIRVNRPETELRYRTGFLAVANPVPDATDLKAEVSNVLDSTLEATSMGISAQVNALASSKVSVALRVPADEVYFVQRNTNWMGSLEVVFAQLGPDGSRLVETRQPLALNFAQPNYEKVVQRGLIFTKTVDVEASAEILKVVVVDSSTGRIGSLRMPLKSK